MRFRPTASPPRKPSFSHLCQCTILTTVRVMSLNHKSDQASFLHLAFKSKLLSQAYRLCCHLVSTLFPYGYLLYTEVISCPQHGMFSQTSGTLQLLFLPPGMPFPNSFPGELISTQDSAKCHHLGDAWVTVPQLPHLGSLVAPSSMLPTTSHSFLSRFLPWYAVNSCLRGCLANPLHVSRHCL